MTKHLIYILIGLFFISCNCTDNYPKDKSVSNTNGKPKDSLTFYFPTAIKRDTQIVKTKIDTFSLNRFSSVLYAAREPILYNFYLGHDIYRLLWLRTWHKPVIISINKNGNRVWLTIKELDRQPRFHDMTYVKPIIRDLLPNGEIDTTKKYDTEMHIDSIVKGDRKANMTLNETKELTDKDWTEFENLIQKSSFWTLERQQQEKSFSCNGSSWIIEGHLADKYWFVDRKNQEWARNDFREAARFLIVKSGMKEQSN